jgi:hypothetical protein
LIGEEGPFATDTTAHKEYGLLRNIEPSALVELLQCAVQPTIP